MRYRDLDDRVGQAEESDSVTMWCIRARPLGAAYPTMSREGHLTLAGAPAYYQWPI
jgi:hypothetical protein